MVRVFTYQPEQIRPAVIFAIGAPTALGEHADMRDLDDAARAAVPGFPALTAYRAPAAEPAVIPG